MHENMTLPKSDVLLTLRNQGPSMDEGDKHGSMIVYGDGCKRVRIEDDDTSGGFNYWKQP